MTRLLTQADLDGFAEVSGDHNPIHTDPVFAATTPFGEPVAHGMFLTSLVSAELGRRWPGHRIQDFSVMFPNPTPVGARVKIVLVPETPDAPGRVGAEVVSADGSVGLRGDFTLTPLADTSPRTDTRGKP